MSHEPFHCVPICHAYIPAPAITTDIIIAKNPSGAAITLISAESSAATLLTGTLTATIKNDAGTTLGTITSTAAGKFTSVDLSAQTLAAGDSIHFNITGIPVTITGLNVTIWGKMPSTA
jgi:hypothetical protein